jgi:hypothetical protein
MQKVFQNVDRKNLMSFVCNHLKLSIFTYNKKFDVFKIIHLKTVK